MNLLKYWEALEFAESDCEIHNFVSPNWLPQQHILERLHDYDFLIQFNYPCSAGHGDMVDPEEQVLLRCYFFSLLTGSFCGCPRHQGLELVFASKRQHSSALALGGEHSSAMIVLIFSAFSPFFNDCLLIEDGANTTRRF